MRTATRLRERTSAVSFRFVVSSRRFWKFLFYPILATLLLRQYQFSRQIDDSFYSSALLSEELVSPTPQYTTPYTSTNNPLVQDFEYNETARIAEAIFLKFSWQDYVATMNITTPGERWKAAVRFMLAKEQKKRLMGIENLNGTKALTIGDNFQRLNERLDEVPPSAIDDPKHWHVVTPKAYRETLQEARASMESVVDQVYSDCILWLLPHPNLTALEVETQDRDKSILKRDPNAGPIIRFQCGTESENENENENNGDATHSPRRDRVKLQKEPCRSANLCLVRSDPLEWRAYYKPTTSNVHADIDTDTDTGSENDNTTAATSIYNHTDLERRFSKPKDDSSGAPRSAILTMVDTVHYLRSGKETGRPLYGQSFFIWECFLNKASYALRTNRDLYIWIGGFDGDKEDGDSSRNTESSKSSNATNTNTGSVLHQRNTETLKRTFGANCKPENARRNVIHYYKPIAFGALFRKLRAQHQDATEGELKAWFVDADIFFNKEAFFPSSDTNNSDVLLDDQVREPISLDDYFDIAPQASLLGSQNPSGKDDNILINGGLLGLRGSLAEPSDPFDDWVVNLSALWWYCRCGERDQIALWLLLFATWSAESGGDANKFSYPGVVFENYLFSWFAVIPHAQKLLPRLQKIWTKETQGRKWNWNWAGKPSTNSAWTTNPTNANLFDGGTGFLNANTTPRGTYTYPLELPHVLLLPLGPFSLPTSKSHYENPLFQRLRKASLPKASETTSQSPRLSSSTPRTDFYLSIIRKNQGEKKALLTHTKNVLDVCYNFGCWPYLIREDPHDLEEMEALEQEIIDNERRRIKAEIKKKLKEAEKKRLKEMEKRTKEAEKKKLEDAEKKKLKEMEKKVKEKMKTNSDNKKKKKKK